MRKKEVRARVSREHGPPALVHGAATVLRAAAAFPHEGTYHEEQGEQRHGKHDSTAEHRTTPHEKHNERSEGAEAAGEGRKDDQQLLQS